MMLVAWTFRGSRGGLLPQVCHHRHNRAAAWLGCALCSPLAGVRYGHDRHSRGFFDNT